MSNLELAEVSDFMKCFSNPLRLNIILTLEEGEKPVNEIVEETGAKQCYVSQQLNYLTLRNILERRSEGHHVYYSLKMKNVVSMLELVDHEFTHDNILEKV